MFWSHFLFFFFFTIPSLKRIFEKKPNVSSLSDTKEQVVIWCEWNPAELHVERERLDLNPMYLLLLTSRRIYGCRGVCSITQTVAWRSRIHCSKELFKGRQSKHSAHWALMRRRDQKRSAAACEASPLNSHFGTHDVWRNIKLLINNHMTPGALGTLTKHYQSGSGSTRWYWPDKWISADVDEDLWKKS